MTTRPAISYAGKPPRSLAERYGHAIGVLLILAASLPIPISIILPESEGTPVLFYCGLYSCPLILLFAIAFACLLHRTRSSMALCIAAAVASIIVPLLGYFWFHSQGVS